MSPVPARLPAHLPGRPARGPSPSRPGAAGPQLRLVDNTRLDLAARRRRARRLLVVAAVLVVGALLALAGLNAVLVSNQLRIDAVEEEVVEAKARHEALRLEVATLGAPERMMSVAIRLGLGPPETITHVPAAPATPPPAGDALPPASPPGGAAPVSTASTPSLAVKSHLSP